MALRKSSLSATTLSEQGYEQVVARYRERTPRSQSFHTSALPLLPGGINRQIAYHDPYPLFVSRGDGARVTDVDENEYLDAVGNFTSLILGHRNSHVVTAVVDQLSRGTAWAAGSELERQLASMLIERVPSLERVRFTSSGTEATMMAVRAARAATGRPLLAKFEGGYHGLHDYAMISLSPPADAVDDEGLPIATAVPGIPDEVRDTVLVLPFNDFAAVERVLSRVAERVAAVLVEPVMGVAGMIEPRDDFLVRLRELTEQLGIVLIFDEVITLRIASGGAQEVYGVRPDLTALGKIIGGGLPVGAIGGSEKLMRVFDPTTGPTVLLSGTFHANPVTLAAGVATLEQLTAGVIGDLNELGAKVRLRLGKLFEKASRPIQVTGVGSLFNIHFSDQDIVDYRSAAAGDKEGLAWLHLALLNQGVLVAPRGMGCLSVPMSEADTDFLVDGVGRALVSLELL